MAIRLVTEWLIYYICVGPTVTYFDESGSLIGLFNNKSTRNFNWYLYLVKTVYIVPPPKKKRNKKVTVLKYNNSEIIFEVGNHLNTTNVNRKMLLLNCIFSPTYISGVCLYFTVVVHSQDWLVTHGNTRCPYMAQQEHDITAYVTISVGLSSLNITLRGTYPYLGWGLLKLRSLISP